MTQIENFAFTYDWQPFHSELITVFVHQFTVLQNISIYELNISYLAEKKIFREYFSIKHFFSEPGSVNMDIMDIIIYFIICCFLYHCANMFWISKLCQYHYRRWFLIISTPAIYGVSICYGFRLLSTIYITLGWGIHLEGGCI